MLQAVQVINMAQWVQAVQVFKVGQAVQGVPLYNQSKRLGIPRDPGGANGPVGPSDPGGP